MFYPRSFTASSSLNALNTPWFIDYGHLTFWFFFLATFVLIMWLVTLHGLTSKNVEARSPRRETRGFSRAQSGDVMTAILPMTWSITMLMHASTHSLNFDENTAATTFSFTVIAYQWGWNYYFPRDIVDKLTRGPKLVGHNQIDAAGSTTDYAYLLERARSEYMARLLTRGAYSDRFGKDSAANLLSLFTRPGGASRASIGLDIAGGLWANSKNTELARAAWRVGLDNRVVSVLNSLSRWEAAADQTTTSGVWAMSDVGASRIYGLGRYLNESSQGSLRRITKLRTTTASSWSLANVTTLQVKPHFYTKEHQNKSAAFNTTRASHSLALVGNRLSLIHKFLTSSHQLPDVYHKHNLTAAYLRKLGEVQTNLAGIGAVPKWATSTTPNSPITQNNITPNLWHTASRNMTEWDSAAVLKRHNSRIVEGVKLLKAKAQRVERLIALSTKYLMVPTATSQLVTTSTLITPFVTSALSFLAPHSHTQRTSAGAWALHAFKQARLFSGAPHSLTFNNNAILSFDDFGLTNGSAIKQLQLKLIAYAARSLSGVLMSTQNPLYPRTVSQMRNNLILVNFVDNKSRFLTRYASQVAYSRFIKVGATLPASSIDVSFKWPLSLAALSGGEISTARNTWLLASLPTPTDLNDYVLLGLSAFSRPAARFAEKAYVAAIANEALFAPLYPAQLNGKFDFTALGHVNSNINVGRQLANAALLHNSPAILMPKSLINLNLVHNTNNALTTHLQATVDKIVKPTICSFSTPQLSLRQQVILLKSKTLTTLTNTTTTKLIKSPFIWEAAKLARTGRVAPVSAELLTLATAPATTSYSSFFDGATPIKPVRSFLDKTNDPLNFIGKSDFLSPHPAFANQIIFNWYWSWAATTSKFSLPLYKLTKGATVKRPVSGYWNNQWANDRLAIKSILAEQSIDLSKAAHATFIPSLIKLKRGVFYPELAPAVLDAEWVSLNHTPACITPEPYEDVDQSFIHQRLGVEVNTTRRSDHTSKYKVIWGPLAASRASASRPVSFSAQIHLPSVGPAGAHSIPTRVAQELALLNESLLSVKNSFGILMAQARAKMGNFHIDKNYGPYLSNASVLKSKLPTNTATTSHNLRFAASRITPAVTLTHKLSNKTAMWADLWKFKSNLPDSQFAGTQTYGNFYPTYFLSKALIILSLREDLATKINFSQKKQITTQSAAVGVLHPLISDIKELYNVNNVRTARKSLSSNSWWGCGSEFVQAALDKTVNAHLITRAGFNIANDEIGNIRRLRVTKGIYLPSDVPMHVICGSKDVIHSWAIPGLNVKIDCIPGFNSHRRLMLRWRGAYWGQCMEVCGRYHHWMPILVNVVHKDIFLSWCIVYLRLIDDKMSAYDRAVELVATTDLLKLEILLTKFITDRSQMAWDAQKSLAIVSSDLGD